MEKITFTPLETIGKRKKDKVSLTGFTKMVASGNDFVVVEAAGCRLQAAGLAKLARNICNRKFGVGADGLLVLEKSRVADIRMRVFNADGSEAEMCGNGARCVALFVARCPLPVARCKKIVIGTKAGIIEAEVKGNKVKIKLTDPHDLKLDMPLKLRSKNIKINFINTGVPHVVIFVEGLGSIDVDNLGREIRNHKAFSPQGTNVNFVEVLAKDAIAIRTYERGVEAETLACGTGAVASVIIAACSLQPAASSPLRVHTQGGEVLKVYFKRINRSFSNVWLEGTARIVFEGKLEEGGG